MQPAVTEIELLYNEAYTLRHSDAAKANELCNKALVLSKKNNYPAGEARCLGLLGFVAVQEAKYEMAFEMLDNSISIASGQAHMQDAEAFALYCLGTAYIRLGNLGKAVEVERKSLELRTGLNDYAGMALCHFQLGFCSFLFKEYEDSLAHYKKSYAYNEIAGDRVGMGTALNGIGSVYSEMNDFDNALKSFTESQEKRKGLNDPKGVGTNCFMLAMLYFKAKKFNEAVKHCLNGLQIANEFKDNTGIIRANDVLGKVYLATGEYELARKALYEALTAAQESQMGVLEYQVHESIAQFYEKTGDFSKALEHYKKFHTLKEMVIDSQTNTKIKHMELLQQVENTRKESEINHLKNVELKQAYDEIEQKNKDITDSIKYARRIQFALLPNEKYFEKNLNRNGE
jgi:tetratricopeptide (TPR) repeat protein